MSAGLRSLRLPLPGRRPRLGRPELALIVGLLLAGALLRPVLALTPEPIAVAPQYARSALTIYAVLDEPGYLVPVARRTPEGQVDPRQAVLELLAGPAAGPDLTAPFAADANLVGLEIGEGRAQVQLSPGSLVGVDAGRAVDALVLTLTEFPEIVSVTLAVGSQSVDADGAPGTGPLELHRPALNPETPDAIAGGTELYFVYDGEDRYLVPVTRASADGEQVPDRAMAEFLAGPRPDSGLGPVMPSGVRVLSVRVDDGLATVDFNADLVYAYRLSQANAMFVRRAVMATLTGLPGISAGLIEIDGSRLLLYTCVNVTQEFPQARPWAINDEYYLSSLPQVESTAA